MHFLMYHKKALAEPWWGFLHGCDNDCWLALKGVALAAHMRLMLTVWSLAYAPWSHGERRHQAAEAMQELTSVPEHVANDELFNAKFLDIVDDKGLYERLHEDGIRQVSLPVP